MMTTAPQVTNSFAPWQEQALQEISEITHHLIHGQYESPADLATDMNQRATAISHVLAVDTAQAMPQLLDALGAHAMALEFAANEIAISEGDNPPTTLVS